MSQRAQDRRWQTKFGTFVSEFGAERLADILEGRPPAVYQWVKGHTASTPARLRHSANRRAKRLRNLAGRHLPAISEADTMKWVTTTLFWLASCARGFELTDRSHKMRPIYAETRRLQNHEQPRRRIPQFHGANPTGSRVRKPCANPLKESGNRAASVRDFRAFRLFALSITSVCGGAQFSQVLMFSSPLLLLKRKRKRKRITDASAVEKWTTPQKTNNTLKQKKPKPSGLGKRKQCKGQYTRRQNGQRSQEKAKRRTCGAAIG